MKMTSGQLCDEIMEMVERIKLCHMDEAEKHGLTKVQLFAIYSIARHGELPMGQVAGVLHCDASNVTGIVDRLVAQDLIVRQECPTDRRAKKLKLTAKGQAIVAELQSQIPTWIGCDKLTSEERGTLGRLIQKMDA